MTLKSLSISQWFDQRVKRERVVLLVCAVVVLVFLVNLLVLEPVSKQRRMATRSIADLTVKLDLLRIQEATILAREANDPNRKNRLRLEVLETESDHLQQQLETNIVNLVSPRDMPELLKSLLTQQKKLKLIALENLSPEPLNLDLQADESVVMPTLYRHRLNLKFSGDYLTMMRYLRQLEQLPQAMVWEQVEIETLKYPEATIRLQVYTLSLSEGWIGG
ncbi:MAG: type II secretion system protein M [Desulfuromonadales bacterium]|nr:type II secretion system protein M [Desulfuromonadales bacterium]